MAGLDNKIYIPTQLGEVAACCCKWGLPNCFHGMNGQHRFEFLNLHCYFLFPFQEAWVIV